MSWKAIGQVNATIESRINAYSIVLKFLVLQNIANTLPSVQLNTEVMKTINQSDCADTDLSSIKKSI